jgi:hypothetical protein
MQQANTYCDKHMADARVAEYWRKPALLEEAFHRKERLARTCNPSYLGGRDWENRGSRLAWVKRSQSPGQPVAGWCGNAPIIPAVVGNIN